MPPVDENPISPRTTSEVSSAALRGPGPRSWLIAAAVILLIFVWAIAFAGWYSTTRQFNHWVRARAIAEIELVTGGRVELESIEWRLPRLEFELHNLTIHGLEGPGQLPWAHVDRMRGRAKILSPAGGRIGLRSLRLERPVFHLMVNPDGTTNQPVPRRRLGDSLVEQLFALEVNRFEVGQGWLLVNDRALPLDFSGEQVSFALSDVRDVAGGGEHYDGELRLGNAWVGPGRLTPLSFSGNAGFSLWRDRVSLRDLALLSGDSELRATGELRDFAHPEISVSYSANLDLTQAAAPTGGAALGEWIALPELRSGRLTLNGEGKWSGQEFSAAGKLLLKDAEYADGAVRIPAVTLGAQFALTPTNISLSHIFAGALGGTVTGDMEVTGWRHAGPERAGKAASDTVSRTARSRSVSPGEQAGRVRLRGEHLLLTRLAAAVSSPSLPLDRVRLAGIAEATLTAEWKRSPREMVTELALNAVPAPGNGKEQGQPAQVRPSPAITASSGQQAQMRNPAEIPAALRLRASYRAANRRLDIAELALATPETEVQASGAWGSTSGKLALSITSSSPSEWKPLLAGTAGEWPVEVRGRAAFQGSVSGSWRAPVVEGSLQLTDFDTLIDISGFSFAGKLAAPTPTATLAKPNTTSPWHPRSILAKARTALAGRRGSTPPQAIVTPAESLGVPPHRMSWDLLDATFTYSPNQLAIHNARLERKETRMNFDLTAVLRAGKFTDESPFSARAEVRNASLTDLLALGGYSFPATGLGSFSWRVAGTVANAHGDGTVSMTNGFLWGEPFQRLAGKVGLDQQEVRFTDFQLTQSGATARGAGSYNLSSTAFEFKVQAQDVDLAKLPRLQYAAANVSGLLNVRASGSGTKDAPAINAELAASKLMINGERFGDFSMSAATRGEWMTLSARSSSPQPVLTVEGTARLRNEFPAEIKAQCRGLDIDPLLRALLKGRVTAHSSVGGLVTIRGPLRDPGALRVEAELDQFLAEIEYVELRNDGPLHLTLENGRLALDRVALTGSDTSLTVRGTAEITGEKLLDVSARGRVSLKLLQSFDHNLVAYGVSTVNLHVGGTSSHPQFNGRLEVANGGLSYVDLPNGLSDVQGRLVFNQDRLQLEHLTARTGGGKLELGGFISYGQGLGFNLTASGRDLRLRYPPGVSTVANARLALTGSSQSALLSGELTVTRFGINPKFDFGSYLERAKLSAGTVTQESPLSRLRLDVQVASAPELQVETAVGKISGDVDLRVRGTGSHPVVLGRISVVEGTVSIYGTQYHLQRGDITFANAVGIQPVLDLQANATVRDYDITLGFHGPIDKLSTTYRSDPPLPTADIVSLLAFGRTREETQIAQSSSSNQSLPETASYAILNQALTAAVTSRVQKIFGVSRIKIDPQMQNSAGLEYQGAGPTVTIEQQVANRLTVTYISNLSRSNYQTIQAEYNLNRNVSVIAVRDWNGIVSFDIKIRQRRR